MDKDYQKYVRLGLVHRSVIKKRNIAGDRLLLEMAGEVGELINAYKHEALWLRDEGKLVPTRLPADSKSLDEASDVLWYLTAFLETIGCTLQDAMFHNMNKLNERYGDTIEDSSTAKRGT